MASNSRNNMSWLRKCEPSVTLSTAVHKSSLSLNTLILLTSSQAVKQWDRLNIFHFVLLFLSPQHHHLDSHYQFLPLPPISGPPSSGRTPSWPLSPRRFTSPSPSHTYKHFPTHNAHFTHEFTISSINTGVPPKPEENGVQGTPRTEALPLNHKLGLKSERKHTNVLLLQY